ncbi:FG-GAP repeat protein [Vibrio coralliilyticus]|uniref:FG-GAP repeat protein n=1 Tax=Vibrio coralliilyticus TaxID=190893 RepID=UPI001E3022AF|nr:FG-GAP repeat protein [Vibrio coralliilyticus]MCC2525792.1 FG-GAP repeat protein [Vibrio coralliilyticus]
MPRLKALLVSTILSLLGCQGGDDTSSLPPLQRPEPFEMSSPTALMGKTKTFQFSWQQSDYAKSYTLCQKDMSQPNECRQLAMTYGETQYQAQIEQLLQISDEFFVIANNQQGLRKSNEVTLGDNESLSAIGFVKASNADLGDNFGHALALSDDGLTLVVSAIKESSSGSGFNADEKDNGSAQAGAVYVYSLTEGQWVESAYLKASNADKGDQFGYAVALSGDGQTLAVSALQEASNAIGVGSEQRDNSAPMSGAVYVFSRQGEIWQQQAYLKSSNNEPLDSFGFSLSMSVDGKRLLVGAPAEASSSQGVDGNQADNSALFSGAAYLFELQSNRWRQTAYIKASNTDGKDAFGYDVALSADGDRFAVGAPGESSNAKGINDNQSNNSAIDSGAVYLFSNSGGAWAQEAYVKPSTPDAGDQFGFSVSLNGDGKVLSVGAYKESSNADSYGDESNNSAPSSGAAYLFVKDQNVWSQQAYLKPSNADAYDRFGYKTRLNRNGDTLVVSSPQESASGVGLFGDLQDNAALSSGAAYVFTEDRGVWRQTAYLKATNTNSNDQFGSALAMSGKGETLVVGAFNEASSLPISGNAPKDNGAPGSGAVYVY